jgi:predicted RNase H-like HicB family nuclease
MKSVTAIIHKGEKFYIGECLEIDVITQGKSIDETLKNLKEAVALYFEGEKIELPEEPSITVTLGVDEYASA